MTPTIARNLNRTLFVSIPALYDDGVARPCTLLGIELNGLWLHSAELIYRLISDDGRKLVKQNPVVFVPFAQIAGVLVPTIEETPPPSDESPRKITPSASAKRPNKR
jgi:hypothetical protein